MSSALLQSAGISEGELERRREKLLADLTLDEKLGLCAGKGLWQSAGIKRLGLRPLGMTDGPHGIAYHSSFKRATRFPAEIALAATWNTELVHELGKAVGDEARCVGKQVVLGPGVNICRTPLNGRTFEYFTEDPYLNSRLAVAVINGIQSQGVAACIKHFAANNQETRRMSVDVQVSERALREIYLPAFEAAVKEAKVQTIMACYNKVNGDQGCENDYLLNQVLRGEWGFSGLVLSDWFAARNTRNTASAVSGGLDLEMPGLAAKRLRRKDLQKALAQDEINEQQIDNKVRALLDTMLLTGCDQPPVKKQSPDPEKYKSLARQIATESMVLLKNVNQQLPLNVDAIKSIAIVGKHAKHRFTGPLKGGSSGVWPRYEVTPFEALTTLSKGQFEIINDAAKADVAIVFVGLGHKAGQDCEHYDRKTLSLPPEQEQLIIDTAAANANTVVVLINGSPLAMENWIDSASAILEAWYGGQEAGNAVVDLLFGLANPCGKLPVTFPKKIEDCSAHKSEKTFPGDDQVFYEEELMVGYRHFDNENIEPLFPFGFGLSYSEFNYSELQLSATEFVEGEELEISFTLTNSSERAGVEIVQLYIGEQQPRLVRPVKELKGFQRVELAAKESRQVRFSIDAGKLAFYDDGAKQWCCDVGKYHLYIGGSCRDIGLNAAVHFAG